MQRKKEKCAFVCSSPTTHNMIGRTAVFLKLNKSDTYQWQHVMFQYTQFNSMHFHPKTGKVKVYRYYIQVFFDKLLNIFKIQQQEFLDFWKYCGQTMVITHQNSAITLVHYFFLKKGIFQYFFQASKIVQYCTTFLKSLCTTFCTSFLNISKGFVIISQYSQ